MGVVIRYVYIRARLPFLVADSYPSPNNIPEWQTLNERQGEMPSEYSAIQIEESPQP